RPTAEEVLRGIRANLLTIVLPTIGDPYAKTQVQMMAMQLDAVAGQLDGEAGRQSARNDALAELLLRCAAALRATDVPSQVTVGEATVEAVNDAIQSEPTL